MDKSKFLNEDGLPNIQDDSFNDKHVFKLYGYADFGISPKPHIDCTCEAGNHCWWKGDNGMYNRFKHKLGWFPERLDAISLKGKSKVIAIQYCGDIAHESVEDLQILRIFGELLEINHKRKIFGFKPHTFLILTKFPERLYKTLFTSTDDYECVDIEDMNKDGIWIGTSITGANPELDDERLMQLMRFNGFKKWVSIEPILGKIQLLKEFFPSEYCEECHNTGHPFIDTQNELADYDYRYECSCKSSSISQVIAGAETGSGARPCDPNWLRAIRDDCKEAGVSFFLKQINANRNRVLDERTHDRLEWE